MPKAPKNNGLQVMTKAPEPYLMVDEEEVYRKIRRILLGRCMTAKKQKNQTQVGNKVLRIQAAKETEEKLFCVE